MVDDHRNRRAGHIEDGWTAPTPPPETRPTTYNDGSTEPGYGQNVCILYSPRQKTITSRPLTPPASSLRCASAARSGGNVSATRSVSSPAATCWASRSNAS